MKNLLLTLLFSSGLCSTYAQYRVSGYIEDRDSREKLYGATVLIDGTTNGSTSNFYGFFSLPVNKQSFDLVFSFVGYQDQKIHFDLTKDTVVNIQLALASDLDEVIIESTREEAIELQPQVSSISIPSQQLLKLPAIAGEIDVLKALQFLPGVQSGSEGSTGLYVRGGGPDQNLILLDGVPLYSVSHLGGLFSVFNPDMISDVNLIKGGYPARYGGRLSSVINIRTKDGNRNARATSGAIGLLSARLTTEGPINKGKGSYVVGFRRTYLDLFTRPISRAQTNGEVSFGYLFYDFNAKANYELSTRDKLFVSTYAGDDKLFSKFESEANGQLNAPWGNLLSTVKWNHLFSDRLFTNLSLNYTRYRFAIGYEEENKKEKTYQSFEYRSGIQDLGARYEAEYYLNSTHNLISGLHFTEHYFTPGLNVIKTKEEDSKTDTTYGSFNVRSREVSWYLEDHWEPTDRLKFNLGVHLNSYFVGGKTYMSPQPRATARYLLDKKSSVKISYASMQQNVHLLSNSGVGLPSDLWVPATRQTAPQKSYQFTAAYSRTLPGGFEASIEGYYKKMTDLITYSPGENWLDGSGDWQERIEKEGVGHSRGAEFFIHKKQGRFTGWVGYTLSRTDRRFENINEGKAYPYKYDRRHDVGILLTYELSDRVDVSATWVYGTGNAITLGEGRYIAADYNIPFLDSESEFGYYGYHSEIEHYEGRNQFRMKAYHRADLGLRFTKQKKRGTRTWNWGFYNVYNRANPYYYYWASSYSQNEGRRLKQIALFPIIPAFSYEFKF